MAARDAAGRLRAALHQAAAGDGLALEGAGDAATLRVAGLLVELGGISHGVRDCRSATVVPTWYGRTTALTARRGAYRAPGARARPDSASGVGPPRPSAWACAEREIRSDSSATAARSPLSARRARPSA